MYFALHFTIHKCLLDYAKVMFIRVGVSDMPGSNKYEHVIDSPLCSKIKPSDEI